MKVNLALLGILSVVIVVPPSHAQSGRKNLASHAAGVPKMASVPDIIRDACYRLSLENPKARVFTVNVAPDAATQVNSHRHDYLVVSLGENHMRVTGNMSAFDFDLEESNVQIVKGGWPHRVFNKGKAALHFLEVDVPSGIAPEHAVCGLGRRSCSDGRFGKTAAGHYSYSTLFETTAVKLRRVEMEAGVSLPDFSTQQECLLLALSEVRLASEVSGQAAEPIHMERGTALWVSAADLRAARNTGQTTAKFLVLEVQNR